MSGLIEIEKSFIFGINNFSQLVLETNTYYPITAETVNDEVILRITDTNFATELGVDEDGMLYRLIEV